MLDYKILPVIYNHLPLASRLSFLFSSSRALSDLLEISPSPFSVDSAEQEAAPLWLAEGQSLKWPHLAQACASEQHANTSPLSAVLEIPVQPAWESKQRGGGRREVI